ncbi:MAG: M20/M25/M40 family metallo-hydrolase, partial [Pseudomonadota bacterium]
MHWIDPVDLTAELIRCRSVTPAASEALDLVADQLAANRFHCTRVHRNGVDNLYARWGAETPVFAFGGHVDVVPPGDEDAWTFPPFAGIQKDGVLWGRGAVDMKSGVAAFVSAACQFVGETPP